MTSEPTEPALEFLLQRAGLTLTPEQKAALLSAYPPVAKMVERVRNTRSHMAEPAHVFIPGEEATP